MDQPKRIAIVGGGITGLALAVALERLNKESKRFEVYVFEQQQKYPDNMAHYILYKTGLKALLELGLGKRLSRIGWPIASFKSLESESGEILVDWSNEQKQESSDFDYLPSMFGVRQVDLIRLLLTSLAGREDLVHGLDLVIKEASNANMVQDGIEHDLALQDWFEKEFQDLLPQFYFGYELESYQTSAEHGMVTLFFTNGQEVDCDVLIGADGFHSKVREFVLHNRCPPQHCSSCVLQGIVRLYCPAVDAPSKLSDGTPIQQLNRDQLLRLCPDGTAQSFVGQGISFGLSNLGNGMIGWTLVAHQQKPRAFVEEILVGKARDQIHLASLTGNALGSQTFGIPRQESGGSAEDWVLPPSERSSQVSPNSQRPSAVQEPATREQETKPATVVADPNQMELTKEEIVQLGLALAMKDRTMPKEIFGIIAESDPQTVFIKDNVDLAEEPPASYITPKFHPGRVILVGDAAHAIATCAHGSVGASLGLCDAVVLGKLFGYAFSAQGTADIIQKSPTNQDLDSMLLSYIGNQFVQLRQPPASFYLSEARQAVHWKKQPEGIWKSMTKLSVGYTWTRSTFKDMQTRGGVEMDPNIVWPKLHQPQ
ncbi:hypothetical protein EDD86DRAFT_215307, partial [Gorgonomyces haynaldii]